MTRNEKNRLKVMLFTFVMAMIFVMWIGNAFIAFLMGAITQTININFLMDKSMEKR